MSKEAGERALSVMLQNTRTCDDDDDDVEGKDYRSARTVLVVWTRFNEFVAITTKAAKAVLLSSPGCSARQWTIQTLGLSLG
jgi:hypothetical protein